MLYLLRQTPVKTLKHLPKFLPKDNDFKNTALICDDEHEKLRLTILDVKDQFFVETATWGLSDWERVLNIFAEKGATLDDRRTQILLKLQNSDVVSEQFMVNIINKFLNDNSGQIIQHNDKYFFDVIFNKDSCFDLKKLTETIELYKPAHLGFIEKEQQILNSNITFSAKLGVAEVIKIDADTVYNIEPIENNIVFGAKLGIAEITEIRSE